nr:immunoglobulin light chain junction region [Mus musculus]
CQQFTSSPFTF